MHSTYMCSSNEHNMEDTSTKEGGTDNMNDTGVRENTEGDKIPFEFLSG